MTMFNLVFQTNEISVDVTDFKIIYLGLHVAFNTVQVISRWVVGRAEETSTYSWSRFCTVTADQQQATTSFLT